MIKMHTNHGVMTLELDADKAPKTVENFLTYAREGFYDGTIFHRVIKGFMNQGGGFEPGMSQKKTHEPIENEADNGLSNSYGTIAMARTMDPHSATAQFFINAKDNTFLDHTGKTPDGWGYCVFGRIVDGTDVIDAINNVATGSSHGHGDVPLEDVVLEKVEVID